MTTQNQKKKKNFVEEMKTSAIIDTACTETIPLEEWFQSYIKNLDDTQLLKLKYLKVTKHLNLVMDVKLWLHHKPK